MVYSEKELIIPALRLLKNCYKGLSTSILIKELTNILNPTGHDVKIIKKRKDTYFSQKVRNLKSHDNLTGKGLATQEKGIWKITELGLKYLEENEGVYFSLQNQGFNKKYIVKEVKEDFKDLIIEEGTERQISLKQRKRSGKLREYAIKNFTDKEGNIICEVCAFNFVKKYGEHGKGFIEIHHKKPIHQKDIKGASDKISEAIKEVSPLCSNCHRMIHRKKDKMLTPEELKEMVKSSE